MFYVVSVSVCARSAITLPTNQKTNSSLNSFYRVSSLHRLCIFHADPRVAIQDSSHPFVQSMVDFLIECNLRANRPGLLTSMMMGTTAKYEQDIKTMQELADESKSTSPSPNLY